MHVWSRGLKVPVAAAVAAVTLTVAGCGSGEEPLVSASAQAAATSAAPSLDSQPPIEVPPELLPAWWAEAGDVFPAEYGIPAVYSPDYVFSKDTPRGAHEQWIFDNYPEYWAAGVRAMSPYINWLPLGWDGKGLDAARDENGEVITDENGKWTVVGWPEPGPAPLVQFYDGVRYDGTPMLPLAFGTNDPLQNPPVRSGDGGRTLYKVNAIAGHGFDVRPPTSGDGEREPFITPVDKRGFPVASVRVYSLDEMVDYLKSGEYIKAGKDVPENQWRKLMPGEFAAIGRHDDFPIEGADWDAVAERFYLDKALCDWKPQYRTEYPDLCANQP